jgi:hypothetical protein
VDGCVGNGYEMDQVCGRGWDECVKVMMNGGGGHK